MATVAMKGKGLALQFFVQDKTRCGLRLMTENSGRIRSQGQADVGHLRRRRFAREQLHPAGRAGLGRRPPFR